MDRATIIEESETPQGSRMATVRTVRGEEFIIDLDRLAESYADFLSNLANEERFGWTLTAAWFESELSAVSSAVRRVESVR